MRVLITNAFSYNVTGYDREETSFAPGEQDVPERVGEYIARTPALGRVLDAEEVVSAEEQFSDGAIAELTDRVAVLEEENADLADGAAALSRRITELETELAEAKALTTDERVIALEKLLSETQLSLKEAQEIVSLRGFEAMTVPELKEYAVANQVDLGSASTKADIIEVLMAAVKAVRDSDT